jgi:hypothetical protein
MNVNSVTSLLPSYLQPFNGTATSVNTANSASSVQQQADVLGLSPAASFLNQLPQLQTQSPQEFQAVLSELTGQPQQADSSDPPPGAQQTQQAGLTVPKHGGGHNCSGSSRSNAVNAFQAAGTQSQTLAASIFGPIIPQQNPQSLLASGRTI